MVDELRGTLTNGDSVGYGLGLFLGQHGGDRIGYHAAYARYLQQRVPRRRGNPVRRASRIGLKASSLVPVRSRGP